MRRRNKDNREGRRSKERRDEGMKVKGGRGRTARGREGRMEIRIDWLEGNPLT